MFRSDDLSERLPYYTAAMDSLANMEHSGALEGVPEAVLDSAKHSQPVGIGRNDTIRFPKGYDPANGPAALMLLPNESGRTVQIPSTESRLRLAHNIISMVGIDDLRVEPQVIESQTDISSSPEDSIAWTSQRFMMIPHAASPNTFFPVLLPNIMVFANSSTGQDSKVVQSMIHESSHWTFTSQGLVALQKDPERKYQLEELTAITEKETYHQVNLRIAHNLGYSATIQQVSDRLNDIDVMPSDARILYDAVFEQLEGYSYEEKALLTGALTVKAITDRFSDAAQPITYNEVIALQAARMMN